MRRKIDLICSAFSPIFSGCGVNPDSSTHASSPGCCRGVSSSFSLVKFSARIDWFLIFTKVISTHPFMSFGPQMLTKEETMEKRTGWKIVLSSILRTKALIYQCWKGSPRSEISVLLRNSLWRIVCLVLVSTKNSRTWVLYFQALKRTKVDRSCMVQMSEL